MGSKTPTTSSKSFLEEKEQETEGELGEAEERYD